MTATELWNRLDVLAASKDTSNALLETADLLREHGDLPLLIACQHSGDRIHQVKYGHSEVFVGMNTTTEKVG